MRSIWLVGLLCAACQRNADKKPPVVEDKPAPVAAKQPDVQRPKVTPPLPVAAPPADAEQITGIAPAPKAVVFVKRLTAGTGEKPARNDTVMVNMNGWRLNGDTFLTTTTRSRPVQQNLAMLATGFAAGVQTMQVGERAMIWVPPELGYMGPPQAAPETTVYEVELVSLERSPATPPDVGVPPANAQRSPTGLISLVVKPGTGTAKPHLYDGVEFHYSAWDHEGRMLDSSELRKRPKQSFGFREWPGMEEALTQMVVGERLRIWIPPNLADPTLPELPKGLVCMELELLQIVPMKAPPPTPPDLNARPADALVTKNGVYYKLLARGTGTVSPKPTDLVRVNYTGWHLDGRLIDTSVGRGETPQFILGKLIPGWTDVLQLMVAGDKARLWIPPAMAYKNEPGRPSGLLVYDLDLVDITPPPAVKAPVQAVDGPKGGAPK